MIPQWKIYPRSQGHSTVYLQNVVTDPSISVGDYTIYDDFVNDPRDFQRNNVLYHYTINQERNYIVDRNTTRLNTRHKWIYRKPSSS